MAHSYKKYLENLLYPILILCGPSGAGKSTLVKALALIADIYELSISYTTRELTHEEIADNLYVHVSKKQFLRMVKNELFVEWNHFAGNDCYYGTPRSEIIRILKSGKVPVFDVDINGAMQLDTHFLRGCTFREYLDICSAVQEGRIRTRARVGDTEEKIQSRIRTGIRERELMIAKANADPEFFSVIKDYNDINVTEYAKELMNELSQYMKKKSHNLV